MKCNFIKKIFSFRSTTRSTTNKLDSTNTKEKKATQDSSLLHLAIIMDGNGRYAKERSYPRTWGHLRGARQVEKIVDACLKREIKYLTLYAFSTENWKRPVEEVSALMSLFADFCLKQEKKMLKEGIVLNFWGNLDAVPLDIANILRNISFNTQQSKQKIRLTLNIALNYGAREEIVRAVQNLSKDVVDKKLNIEDISTSIFEKYLYSRGIPHPDLLIRTSGEFRLSNFLLWQLAYTEFYISEVNWPEFGEKELDLAISSYEKRNRRYGGI